MDNDLDAPNHDIAGLWDDDRRVDGRDDDDEMDLDDMDGFIEYEDEEGAGVMNEAEREEKRRERRRLEKERRKAMGNRPELAGIDAKYVDQSLKMFTVPIISPVPGTKSMKCLEQAVIMGGLWTMTGSVKRTSTNWI